MKSDLRHVYEIYIRTTPERLWDALTNGEITKKYFFGTEVRSRLSAGDSIAYTRDGELLVEGKVIESDPPRKLAYTFKDHAEEETRNDRPSRVTYEIEPMGELCKLTLVHDDFDGETPTFKSVRGGWNVVLSGLKTLLETGRPLNAPHKEEAPS